MPRFSAHSRQQLETCHRDLQLLFNEVIKYFDCRIEEGHRDEESQNAAADAGFSQLRWPHSRHNKLPSEAVDVTPWPERWKASDEKFRCMAHVIENVARMMGIRLTWGGRWLHFRDRPHWELRND